MAAVAHPEAAPLCGPSSGGYPIYLGAGHLRLGGAGCAPSGTEESELALGALPAEGESPSGRAPANFLILPPRKRKTALAGPAALDDWMRDVRRPLRIPGAGRRAGRRPLHRGAGHDDWYGDGSVRFLPWQEGGACCSNGQAALPGGKPRHCPAAAAAARLFQPPLGH